LKILEDLVVEVEVVAVVAEEAVVEEALAEVGVEKVVLVGVEEIEETEEAALEAVDWTALIII
jgi:hypothetical protein